MTDRGTATLYASDHIYSEVYEHLPKIARWSKVPTKVLRARFEEKYLPVLRFVTVDISDIADPQVLAITDPDDVPSGQLAKLIVPCVVFSEDRHLRTPGLAPEDWRLITQCAVDLVEAATRRQQIDCAPDGLAIPLSAAIELIKFLGRRTGVPPWLIGAAMVGGGALLLKKPERRQAASRYIHFIMETYGAEAQQAVIQEQRGLSGLREVMLPAPEMPSAKQQAAIVLARQREPLLAREIQERMLVHFQTELVPTVSEVRAVLKDGSEFVQPEQYRWQFGREADPWKAV